MARADQIIDRLVDGARGRAQRPGWGRCGGGVVGAGSGGGAGCLRFCMAAFRSQSSSRRAAEKSISVQSFFCAPRGGLVGLTTLSPYLALPFS
jgi:hypothetical protein